MPPDDEELDLQPVADDEPLDLQPLDGAGAATPPPPPAPKPTTAQANAAWADSLGPGQRAEALTRALRSGASEQDRARAQYLLGRHFDQSMGTEDTAAPIVGRDERPTAGLTGLAQGATLGFADEIGGAMRAQAGEGSYVQERDRLRQQYRGAREQAPARTTQGEIAGTVPYAAIPGGGATAAERVAVQAGIGAGLGTASGAGFSEAETAPEVAEDAAMGGALGLVLGGGGALVGEGVSAGIGRARAFADDADRLRLTSVAPGRGGQIEERIVSTGDRLPGGREGAAEALRRLRIGGGLSTADDVAREAQAAVDRIDDVELGPTYDRLDEIARVPRERLLRALDSIADQYDADAGTGSAQIEQYIRSMTERMRGTTRTGAPRVAEDLSYREARNLIEPIRRAARFSGPESRAVAQTGSRDAYRSARAALDEIAGEAIDAADGGGGDAAVRAFQQARNDSVVARWAQEQAQDTASRVATRGFVGLRDIMLAQGAESTSAGVARAMGSRMIGLRESGMRASAADVVRTLLERNPQALGRWAGPLRAAAQQGGSALAAAHMALSTRDPEYRRAIEEASNEAAEAPQE